jgi:GNAT superfamily N-acetyltransferase
MYWRQPGREHWANAGEGNKRRLKAIVDSGRPPGLLAYVDGRPVGWCAVAPREEYGRLGRSPTIGPIDDLPVWSVVCFYIDRKHRRRRVAQRLLDAAVEHVARHGGRLLEGYPVDPRDGRLPGRDAYTGVPRMFVEAGFEEVARRTRSRPIMRFHVRPRGRTRRTRPGATGRPS